MRLALCAVSSAVLAVTHAFEDTSPFIYLSSNALQQPIVGHHQQQSTQSTTTFRASALSSLSCDVPFTIIAHQPSIHASDFDDEESAPRMRQFVSTAGSRIVVPYGHGDLDVEELAQHIAQTCDATIDRIESTDAHPLYDMASLDGRPHVTLMTLPGLPLSSEQRRETLNENDAFLHSFIDSLPVKEYNLIFTTTPPPASPASFRRAHISLSEESSAAAHKNGTVTGGLFSRYQYFTPGIFMGYMALLILVPVLIVGLQAINSLQVSYRAFDPPMKLGQKQQN